MALRISGWLWVMLVTHNLSEWEEESSSYHMVFITGTNRLLTGLHVTLYIQVLNCTKYEETSQTIVAFVNSDVEYTHLCLFVTKEVKWELSVYFATLGEMEKAASDESWHRFKRQPRQARFSTSKIQKLIIPMQFALAEWKFQQETWLNVQMFGINWILKFSPTIYPKINL